MSKQTTSWRKKGRSAATIDFDGSTIDYDGATTPYAGNGETPASVIKQRTAWGKRLKAVTRFLVNPAAVINEYLYNSTSAYNSTQTYNGLVSGEAHSTAKKATDWRQA
jgi:hypothetical protein